MAFMHKQAQHTNPLKSNAKHEIYVRERRRRSRKKTTHWNVDYSRYMNLISNSIHQTLHFFFVWILCLEFFRFFISFIHWLSTDVAMIWISLSLAAGEETHGKKKWIFMHLHMILMCAFESVMLMDWALRFIISNLWYAA